MLVTIPVKFSNNVVRDIIFLVDTGSEVNLIKRGMVPSECWKEPEIIQNLTTACNAPLRGGKKVCKINMMLNALPVGQEERKPFFIEAEFFDGEVHEVQGILSYTWLEKK